MAAKIPPTGARNSPQAGKRASRGLKPSRNVGEMRVSLFKILNLYKLRITPAEKYTNRQFTSKI